MSDANNNKPTPTRPVIVGAHYPELDGIRGIAILLVLFFHSRTIENPHNFLQSIYYKIIDTGWAGVDLFFVLSGFLITGILLDTYANKKYFFNFYMRRILRIFPVYYAFLIFLTIISRFVPIDFFSQKSVIAQLSYWLYLQNWLSLFRLTPTPIMGHTWSLAVEEQFYLVWPALILFAARRNAVGKLCAFIVVLAFIVRAGSASLNLSPYYFTIARMDEFALGACVVVLLRQYGSLNRFRLAALILAFTSYVILAFLAFNQKGFQAINLMVLRVGLLPLGVFFSSILIISLTSNNQGILRRFLRSQWLCFVGKISYGIYIFHWPVKLFLFEFWQKTQVGFWTHQLGFVILVTACSIIIAWLSFTYLETPILRLKQNFKPD